MKLITLVDQIKNNTIAIISLVIAIVALSYNTWRSEVTERNRNFRFAAFEEIKQLDELQLLINYSHYEPENSKGNPLVGWGHIALIGDMSRLLPEKVQQQANLLIEVWKANLHTLKTEEASLDKITHEIDQTRDAILEALNMLK